LNKKYRGTSTEEVPRCDGAGTFKNLSSLVIANLNYHLNIVLKFTQKICSSTPISLTREV